MSKKKGKHIEKRHILRVKLADGKKIICLDTPANREKYAGRFTAAVINVGGGGQGD